MTATVLIDGSIFRIPETPFVLNDAGEITAPSRDELVRVVPLIKRHDLLHLVRRLMGACYKRRLNSRWRAVNQSRLELARLCIDRALAEHTSSNH
jgi:hypothetical protein